MARKKKHIHDEETIGTVGELLEALKTFPPSMPIQIGETDAPVVLREHVPGSGKVFDPKDPDTDASECVLVLQTLDEAEQDLLEQDGFIDADEPDDLYGEEDEEDDPFEKRKAKKPRKPKGFSPVYDPSDG